MCVIDSDSCAVDIFLRIISRVGYEVNIHMLTVSDDGFFHNGIVPRMEDAPRFEETAQYLALLATVSPLSE